jgi:hypothetical protein
MSKCLLASILEVRYTSVSLFDHYGLSWVVNSLKNYIMAAEVSRNFLYMTENPSTTFHSWSDLPNDIKEQILSVSLTKTYHAYDAYVH